MERFVLLKDFSDFRKFVLSEFYPGWVKYKNHDELRKAQEKFVGKNFIHEPAQYPCIVECWVTEETEEESSEKQFDYLYKNNLKMFEELFHLEVLS